MQKPTKEYAKKILELLKQHYPHAKMILEWSNNFELLVAIILSAQCTDVMVNKVTAKIFPKYRKKYKEFENFYKQHTAVILSNTDAKDPQRIKQSFIYNSVQKQGDPHVASAPQDDKFDYAQFIELVNFAEVDIQELEQDIKSTGFYHNKAKNIQGAAKVVLEKYQGILPKTIEELTTIPGVGRKTANVFLGNAYQISEGIAVDTHVRKQSQLLGLTKQANPDKIEQDLMKLFDKKDWFTLTYLLIEHGRNMRKKQSDRIVCANKKCVLCK